MTAVKNRGMAPAKRRVLLIGLDSADAQLIETFITSGHMPNLAGLRRQGVWGRLGTTAEVMHVSAWPTLYTGTTPGHHGLYHAFQVRAGERLQAWLAIQCQSIPGALCGVLLLGSPDSGAFSPAAAWPTPARTSRALTAVSAFAAATLGDPQTTIAADEDKDKDKEDGKKSD